DPAAAMMAQARQIGIEEGVHVDYIEARAEDSGLPDEAFDVITAGQCWHWFKRDVVAREAKRMLRANGALVISHLDWLPVTGNVVAASEALIRRHNPAWNLGDGKGIYPQWFSDLMAAGFVGIESFSFDIDLPYSHETWRGRLRASAGIAASLEAPAIEKFDSELAALLAAEFPEPVLAVPHRVFTVLGRKPG
ncbi:MAG TPA: methyltransferase domain-containing protein, partial [Burkholderiaceae bacterium]